MLMMWNENKSIRALKTETKMLRWGNNCCREDCTHFLFYSFPLCVIFFAASLLSVSDVLVFQVAFLMLFVNLLNKKKKKKLIFLDAWGNSLIPDKLPRKSLKWLSLPQRQGCKNWKGFHFWLFQLLQKETFASVWSLKTVTEQIKITKISICDPPHIQLFCPALSQGINQAGYVRCGQQPWLPGGSCDWYSAAQGFYRKYTQVLVLENAVLRWSGCSLLAYYRKEERNLKWMERRGRSKAAGVLLSVLPSYLHISGAFSWGLRIGKQPGALIPEPFLQEWPEGLGGYLQ